MNNKVSIIVPVYNREFHITKCLDSIINQTYKNIEILVIDDGSTDNSAKIISSYQDRDKRIKLITKTNGGASSARNKGLDIAVGDYIFFIDSDDYLELTALEKLVDAIQSNDFAFVSAKHYSVINDKIIKSDRKYPEHLSSFQCQDYLCECDPVFTVPWNRLFKKNVWDNLRFTEGFILEDEALNHHLFGVGKNSYFLNEETYYHVFHKNSVMGSSSPERLFNGAYNAFTDRLNYYNNEPKYNKLIFKVLKRLYGATILFINSNEVISTNEIDKIINVYQFLMKYAIEHCDVKIMLRAIKLNLNFKKTGK